MAISGSQSLNCRIAANCWKNSQEIAVKIMPYRVVLFRANGREVKRSDPFWSKYSAKKMRDAWNDRYDPTYYAVIVETHDRPRESRWQPPKHRAARPDDR